MPHHFESPRPKAGSDTSTEAHPQAASSAAQPGQFTESQQQDLSAEGIGPESIDPEDIWAPFPPSLFRLPVPNRLFEEMPSLSDSALRCLLALIRLSFRFDPEESQWVCPDRTFRRAAVQEACGLSDEGARQGLTELEAEGWVCACRDGKAHEHRLSAEVPERRFTYVPTALLEEVGEMPTGSLPSGTALRVALAVLHRTWGWARPTEEVDSDRILASGRLQDGQGEPPVVHCRWARLSTSDLSRLTGRSESAVKPVLSGLASSSDSAEPGLEQWISRRRPDRGAYLYRFAGGTLQTEDQRRGEGEKGVPPDGASSDRIANNLPPGDGVDRQRSGPPTSYGENISRDKHAREEAEPTAEENSHPDADATGPGDAVRRDIPDVEHGPVQTERGDLSDFSAKKQKLGRKLINAGVWPERAKECLRRYSAARIESNFKLYRDRKNSSKGPRPKDDGAWLCAAITDGYASNSCHSESYQSNSSAHGGPHTAGEQEGGSEAPPDSTASPEHKQKISPREKATLIRKDLASEEDFHRFRHGDSLTEKQFLYFDPAVGGPGSPGR